MKDARPSFCRRMNQKAVTLATTRELRREYRTKAGSYKFAAETVETKPGQSTHAQTEPGEAGNARTHSS